MKYPKWVTPERQNKLLELFNQSKGMCTLGHSPCFGEWSVKRVDVCSFGYACNMPDHGQTCIHHPYQTIDDCLVLRRCEPITHMIRRFTCGHGDSRCNSAIWRMGEMGNLIIEGEYYYNQVVDRLIKEWANDDRLDRLDLEHALDVIEHRTNDRTLPLHGKYSGISQDIYYSNQADYFIEGYGVSGITCKPFVKLRLSSSQVRLFVEIDNVLKPLSKNQRRKAVRYQHIKANIRDRIDLACIKAVREFKR